MTSVSSDHPDLAAAGSGARGAPVRGVRGALVLAVVMSGVALAATASFWQLASTELARSSSLEFDFQTRQTVRRIAERMNTYEQVQRSTQAFLLGSMDVRRDDFHLFVDSLKLAELYPGIQGIALVELIAPERLEAHVRDRQRDDPGYRVHPLGERPVYSSITHISPYSGLNIRAPGYDMLTNPTRRVAMERARDSGQAAASGKVRLIQEDGRDEQAGLVMYLPVYRRGAVLQTLAQRRAQHIGWVGAPFRMNDLMAGLGGERSGDLTLAIYDGAGIDPAQQLYQSAGPAGPGRSARFRTVQTVSIAGRPWTLEMASTPVFEQRLHSNKPVLVAIIGTAASILLGMLVWALASGRRQALQLAARATDKLRASEFRWKYALEGAGDGVWDWDRPSGTVVYSRRWKEMLGYQAHEIDETLQAFQDLIHPDDLATIQAALASYTDSTDQHYAVEFRLRCKDGSWKWILARGMAVTRDSAGKPLRTIGTHTDISRSKADEAALRHANAMLASEQQRVKLMFENSHDAFIAVSPQGRVTDWSAKAERMLGWPAQQAIGADLAELIIPAPLREAHNAGFRRFVQSGQGQLLRNVVEVEAVHRDGHLVPVELAIAGFPDLQGYAVSAFVRDISERKQAQRLEAERTRDLEEARTALQHAQKLEAVGKLTGGVAHDFNNVLHVIGGNLQLLKMSLSGEERLLQRLASMQSAVDKGAKLSSQLLSFARRQPLQPTVVNLRDVVQGLDGLLRPALGEQYHLRFQVDPGLGNTLVDVGQLENVILNLVINARDAMPNGGPVTISLANHVVEEAGGALREGSYVRLAVTDTGTGMDEHVKALAFEPFFTTKPVGKGTGLGLSMTYGFVKQSGGHIEIDSAPGAGTTVALFFPRSDEAATPAVEAGSAATEGGHEIILVVEDDTEVRSTAVTMLSGFGYHILAAEDGESGLRLLRGQARVDMLFTDVVMPGPVSSTELAREAVARFPHIAVLYTSGYTRDALCTDGRLAAGVHLLGKPYRSEQLAARVRSVLDLSRRGSIQAGEGGNAIP
ncbi:CHASE domain-containing protein [Massilia sp. PAMC28688]|uniref:CHASE domain-containing protein n=1 Tax=Massilia sp. PAMC28688 TaxID=2861283 RepID=UPI001C62736D|nr:CHASE domain-containing protein [Massilia sp. PAMC28688]QYF93204.1 CHASE domain-containing protein [Massilia sp. PAMC28688]